MSSIDGLPLFLFSGFGVSLFFSSLSASVSLTTGRARLDGTISRIGSVTAGNSGSATFDSSLASGLERLADGFFSFRLESVAIVVADGAISAFSLSDNWLELSAFYRKKKTFLVYVNHHDWKIHFLNWPDSIINIIFVIQRSKLAL